MTLMDEAANGLGAVLLPVVAGLLFEELTLGGLVRLLIAPWPKTNAHGAPGGGSLPLKCSCSERNHHVANGENKCSH